MTRAGQELVGQPGRIFGLAVPFFLFRVNHDGLPRVENEPIPGNWDIFLNVLNVVTKDSATGGDIRRVLHGDPESSSLPRYDEVMGSLYVQVLRPLCWSGLLIEEQVAGRFLFEDRVFRKTPLWRAALDCDTDDQTAKSGPSPIPTRH